MGVLARLFNIGRADREDPGATSTGGFFRFGAAEPVTEQTAIRYSAVWACVRLISETIAGLPWHVFERHTDGRGRDRVFGGTDTILSRSWNTEMSAFDGKQATVACALLWGNGYCEIERRINGQPAALWPIHPQRVEPTRDQLGNLVYEIDGGRVVIPAADMYHLKGAGFDGLMGQSVLSLAADAIGAGLAADKFIGSFFANGTNVRTVLKTPDALNEEAVAMIRKRLEDFRGSANANKTLILDKGKEFLNIGMPLEDAQFLEERKYTINDIARWFRVPPHKIGDLEKATFSNIEQQNIEFATDAIMPWLVRAEQEADRKLLGAQQRERQFTKVNMSGLLRGDSKARGEFYQTMFSVGAMSPNDIREKEDMNPVPDGDTYLVQMNLQPLDSAATPTSEPSPADDEPGADLTPVVREALERVEAFAGGPRGLAGGLKRHAEDRTAFLTWAADWGPKLEQYATTTMTVTTRVVAESLGRRIPDHLPALIGQMVASRCMAQAETFFDTGELEALEAAELYRHICEASYVPRSEAQ